VRAPDNELAKIWYDPVRLEQRTNDELDALDWGEIHLSQELEDHYDLEQLRNVRPDPRLRYEAVYKAALANAHKGNLAPLRKLLVEITGDNEVSKFIHEPKRKRGQRRPKMPPPWKAFEDLDERLQQAVEDVKRIRRIWREQFHKTYRSVEPTADAIAARRHGLTERELDNYRKCRHRPR
jgi:hypothetical protein